MAGEQRRIRVGLAMVDDDGECAIPADAIVYCITTTARQTTISYYQEIVVDLSNGRP